MKIIKILLAILALFIIAFILAGFTLPAQTTVERSIIINQPIEQVFAKVNNYHEFNTWSPWAEKDKATRYTYLGPASGVGAKMSWHSSNPEVGSGSQEIIASIVNERVTTQLKFDQQNGDALAEYILLPVMDSENPQTHITWTLQIDNSDSLIGRYFGLMMDDWVGVEYERGLANLKQIMEAQIPIQPVL